MESQPVLPIKSGQAVQPRLHCFTSSLKFGCWPFKDNGALGVSGGYFVSSSVINLLKLFNLTDGKSLTIIEESLSIIRLNIPL